MLWIQFKLKQSAQCLFQLPEKGRRVKGNQISPVKQYLSWDTSEKWCSDPSNPFASLFCLLSRRPAYHSVLPSELSRGNRCHYALTLDRHKVTTSKFGKFLSAAWLTGLAIRELQKRHSFRVSTCILSNSSTSHLMTSPSFCASTNQAEHTFSPASIQVTQLQNKRWSKFKKKDEITEPFCFEQCVVI